MSAQYIMKKMPDIHGTGEEITYPQMVMTGQTGTRELAEYISANRYHVERHSHCP